MAHYDKIREQKAAMDKELQQSIDRQERVASQLAKTYEEYGEWVAEQKPDNVNHPQHYKAHPSGIEVIEITEHMNFNLGNVIKYVMRHEHKNGVEDLKKAKWYLEREIANKEAANEVVEDLKKEWERQFNEAADQAKTYEVSGRGTCTTSPWVFSNGELNESSGTKEGE
jgi:hypothetical protein